MDCSERLNSILPELISLRRTLHAYPELSFQEYETSRLLRERLNSIPGLEVTPGFADTGIVATLNRHKPGPCIAFRADMDALPIQEQSGKLYSSKRDGIMHACGHDGHMACLIGAAQLLSTVRDSLSGPVKFIFQPAEEFGAGAERMIQDGALRDPDATAIFALHGWPELEVGTIAITPGAIMAGDDEFCIRIDGVGAHAAQPHRGIDPVVVASHIILGLQSVVSRLTDPTKALVVTIGKIESGSSSNIIPEYAVLHGTVRALNDEVRTSALIEIGKIAAGIAKSFGATSAIEWTDGCPVVVNDVKATSFVDDIARQMSAIQSIKTDMFPIMAAEDFAFYQREIPGAFIALGLRPENQQKIPGLHQSGFDFTDGALETGVLLFTELALRFADSWKKSLQIKPRPGKNNTPVIPLFPTLQV